MCVRGFLFYMCVRGFLLYMCVRGFLLYMYMCVGGFCCICVLGISVVYVC